MICMLCADPPAMSWDGEFAAATEVSFASCTFPGRGQAGPSGFFLAALKVPTDYTSSCLENFPPCSICFSIMT